MCGLVDHIVVQSVIKLYGSSFVFLDSYFLMLSAHAHKGYSTLCVCVCVCVRSFLAPSNVNSYNTLITEIGFVLNAKDFQLMDFSDHEKAPFESYNMAAIYFVDMLTQHVDDMHTCIYMHTARAH